MPAARSSSWVSHKPAPALRHWWIPQCTPAPLPRSSVTAGPPGRGVRPEARERWSDLTVNARYAGKHPKVVALNHGAWGGVSRNSPVRTLSRHTPLPTTDRSPRGQANHCPHLPAVRRPWHGDDPRGSTAEPSRRGARQRTPQPFRDSLYSSRNSTLAVRAEVVKAPRAAPCSSPATGTVVRLANAPGLCDSLRPLRAPEARRQRRPHPGAKAV